MVTIQDLNVYINELQFVKFHLCNSPKIKEEAFASPLSFLASTPSVEIHQPISFPISTSSVGRPQKNISILYIIIHHLLPFLMHIRAVLLPFCRTKRHVAAASSAHASAHETAGVAEHKAAFIFLVAHPFFFGNALDIFFQFQQFLVEHFLCPLTPSAKFHSGLLMLNYANVTFTILIAGISTDKIPSFKDAPSNAASCTLSAFSKSL